MAMLRCPSMHACTNLSRHDIFPCTHAWMTWCTLGHVEGCNWMEIYNVNRPTTDLAGLVFIGSIISLRTGFSIFWWALINVWDPHVWLGVLPQHHLLTPTYNTPIKFCCWFKYAGLMVLGLKELEMHQEEYAFQWHSE